MDSFRVYLDQDKDCVSYIFVESYTDVNKNKIVLFLYLRLTRAEIPLLLFTYTY